MNIQLSNNYIVVLHKYSKVWLFQCLAAQAMHSPGSELIYKQLNSWRQLQECKMCTKCFSYITINAPHITRVKGLHQKTKNVQGMQRLQVASAYRN